MLRRAIGGADQGRGAGQGGRAAQPDLRLAAPGRSRRPTDQHDHLGRVRRPLPPHDRARGRADRPSARRVRLARARKRRPPRGGPLIGRGLRDGLEGRVLRWTRRQTRGLHALDRRTGRRSRSSSPACRSTLTGSPGGSDFSCSSIGEWRRAIGSWLTHPEDNKVLIATSILLDGRPVFGPDELDPKQEFYEADEPGDAAALDAATGARHQAADRLPARTWSLEHSGEHRGTLDIKHGGLLPIVDIARYAGLKARTKTTSTIERLRAASDARRPRADPRSHPGGGVRPVHGASRRASGQPAPARREARRPSRPEGAQLAHPPLPARRVPRGDRGAEEARRGAAVAGDQLTPTRSPSAAARAYVETPMPDPSMRWSEVSFAALDFETTGLDPRATRSSRSRRSRSRAAGSASPTAATASCARRRMPGRRQHPHPRPAARRSGGRSAARRRAGRAAGGDHGAGGDRPRRRGRARLPRRAALGRRGLELRNPIVDTAALAAELQRRTERFGSGRAPTGSQSSRARSGCRSIDPTTPTATR